MGTRYYVDVTCANCGHREENVYYAPTCGFVDWKCPECDAVTDLGKYTGISYEEASNRAQIESLVTDAIGQLDQCKATVAHIIPAAPPSGAGEE